MCPQSTRLHGTCATCGTPISSKPSRPQRYCSKLCVDQAPHPRQPVAERFWSYVHRTDTCWLWTGPMTRGYGRFRVVWNESCVRAHRFAWELTYGPIPDGLLVLHRCNTPACVRPDHLYLGDQRQNMVDRSAAGTGFRMVGEQHARARLTVAQVREIRARVASGESRIDLAREYHVAYPTIEAVITRRNWSHVD